MDGFQDFNHQPLSYYECVIKTGENQVEAVQSAKERAFEMMSDLEGWCPRSKASILMDLIFMVKPAVVVEIGVFGGKSLIPMAYALKERREGKIYGIDPYSSVESAKGMDGINLEYWSTVNHEAILKGFERKIQRYELEDQVVLIRNSSEEAPVINDIEILHIDGNHSEVNSLGDVTKWVPLVKKGGLIVFNDINWVTTADAVLWLDKHCIKIAEFKEDNTWGIWVKPGDDRERRPNWRVLK